MQRAAIGTILPNPSNPRIIKDDKFKKLVKSIQEFPEMLELRPIVVDGNMVVLGGNMRLKACISAGLKDIPIIIADQLTDAQKGEFIIKDNVGFGEWDWDLLANEWEPDALIDWGLDLPILMDEPSYDELIGDEKGNPATMKITFDSPEQLQKAEIDIQELLDRKYQGAYFSVSAGGI
jgi:ParB-like chromosome segregation protein Spo0J